MDTLEFSGSPVSEALICDLYEGHFLEDAQNLIFIGGTGTGKTHLAIAIASHCIRLGRRSRFYSAINLVNQLEQEKHAGKAGRQTNRLVTVYLVVSDELIYLPFSQAGGALLRYILLIRELRCSEHL